MQNDQEEIQIEGHGEKEIAEKIHTEYGYVCAKGHIFSLYLHVNFWLR